MSNLELINDLVKVKQLLIKSKEQAELFLAYIEGTTSKHSDPLVSRGYGCYVNMHSDGSGSSINLTGCYVGHEVVTATISIIETRIEAINEKLKSLDVDITQ